MKLITALLAVLITANAYAADKYLQYKYNDAVTIVLSSALCPFPQLKDEYKYSVAAFRVDGQKLAGCYKKLDEDMLELQWHKGDKTILPANAFLQPNSTVPNVNVEPSL